MEEIELFTAKSSKVVDKTLKVWEREYKKGFFPFLILFLLRCKEGYGYEIATRLRKATLERLRFEYSSIYQILKRLEKKGFILGEWRESPAGPRRKIYRLTEIGEALYDRFYQEEIVPLTILIANVRGKEENNE